MLAPKVVKKKIELNNTVIAKKETPKISVKKESIFPSAEDPRFSDV